MRAELHEYKAQPGLVLQKGEKPPSIPPKVTPESPISPTDIFATWDWERSRATRRGEDGTLFEYVNIEADKDAALVCWPELAEPIVVQASMTEPAWLGPQAVRPGDIQPKVWRVMRAIADLEIEGRRDLDDISKKEEQKLVVSKMWRGAKCSLSTLYKAEKKLRELRPKG
jgi:hypothetical protein